ncbi:MAG: hypothetical protein FWB83_06075, partial [Treponema sp.]|nr:hypothetical protein [Treponema sp.]
IGIWNALRASISVLEGAFYVVCGVVFILYFMYVICNAKKLTAYLTALFLLFYTQGDTNINKLAQSS